MLLLAPISLGPGEATHSELLGTKKVNPLAAAILEEREREREREREEERERQTDRQRQRQREREE